MVDFCDTSFKEVDEDTDDGGLPYIPDVFIFTQAAYDAVVLSLPNDLTPEQVSRIDGIPWEVCEDEAECIKLAWILWGSHVRAMIISE